MTRLQLFNWKLQLVLINRWLIASIGKGWYIGSNQYVCVYWSTCGTRSVKLLWSRSGHGVRGEHGDSGSHGGQSGRATADRCSADPPATALEGECSLTRSPPWDLIQDQVTLRLPTINHGKPEDTSDWGTAHRSAPLGDASQSKAQILRQPINSSSSTSLLSALIWRIVMIMEDDEGITPPQIGTRQGKIRTV